MKVDICSLL